MAKTTKSLGASVAMVTEVMAVATEARKHTTPAEAVAQVAADAVGKHVADVYRDHNAHCVCVYNRGPQLTYFLSIDGVQLHIDKLPHDQFAETYSTSTGHTALDFARTWTKSDEAIRMVPISGAAFRVLKAILAGHSVGTDDEAPDLSHLEKHMASAEEDTGFRKPDGPVAKVHAHLDKHLDRIKAGTVSRKELIDALVAKNMSVGTVTTQAGVWARNNGVTFARPSAAAGAKKEAKAKATKKAAKVAAPRKARAPKAEAQVAA